MSDDLASDPPENRSRSTQIGLRNDSGELLAPIRRTTEPASAGSLARWATVLHDTGMNPGETAVKGVV